MQKLLSLCSLISLLFLVACGSSNSSPSVTPPGNFSLSSVSGQYAYQFSGIDLTTSLAYSRAGVFTADGNGNITSGTDDFSEGTTAVSNPISGTYSVANDGTGTATINVAGATITLGITLVSSSKIDLIEADFALVGSGVAEKQSTSAFSSIPTGTYAFRMQTASPSLPSTASVGAITISSGVVTGSEDINSNGVVSSATLSGSFNAPDTTIGRGTGTLTDSLGNTTTFDYYIVDSNTLLFFSTTSATIGLGRAELQSGSFSNSSLNGGYAFGIKGDTASFINGFQAVGRFAADGNGNISAGAEDNAQDGTISSNVSFTGSYSVASNGRAAVTISGTGLASQEILWLVNSSRAFVLINSSAPVAIGTIDVQQGATFTNSSLVGQFTFVMDGFDTTPNTYDRVGTLQWDGAGHLTLSELINFDGTTNTALLSGTYSVAQNGRVSGSVSSLSGNLVFYLISGSDGYILQADQGFVLAGRMTKQQ